MILRTASRLDVSIASVAGLLLFALPMAHSAEWIDQSHRPSANQTVASLEGTYFDEQTFRPRLDSLDFVDFLLKDDDYPAGTTNTMVVKIRKGDRFGPVVGTSEPVTLTVGEEPAMPRFTFSVQVELAPESEYRFDARVENANLPWRLLGGAPGTYERGYALDPYWSNLDYYFVEGATALPCSLSGATDAPGSCNLSGASVRITPSIQGAPQRTYVTPCDSLFGCEASGFNGDNGQAVAIDWVNGGLGVSVDGMGPAVNEAVQVQLKDAFTITLAEAAMATMHVDFHALVTGDHFINMGGTIAGKSFFGIDTGLPGSPEHVLQIERDVMLDLHAGENVLNLTLSFFAMAGNDGKVQGMDTLRVDFDLPVGATIISLGGFGSTQAVIPLPAPVVMLLPSLIFLYGIARRRDMPAGERGSTRLA